VSPVVGTVLLLGIVVLLVGVSSVLFLGLTDESEPKPDVVLEMEETGTENVYRLVHEGGDELDGDKVVLRGAANETALTGTELSADDSGTFVPVREEIQVLYFGEHGNSYVVVTFEPESTVPDPDEGCDWVDNESDGGTDPVKIDGIVVDCDVTTSDGIEIQNGGVVVGEAVSGTKDLDADDATVYGDVDVEKVLNVQNGTVSGSATSQSGDVKLNNASVGGSVTAEKVVELQRDSSVDGDVESATKPVKVLDSTVNGSITGASVKLDGATIEGDVYVDSTDFDCTNSTINGQDCGEYTPKDPSNW